MIINKQQHFDHKLLQRMILDYMSNNDWSTKEHTIHDIWCWSAYVQEWYEIRTKDETHNIFQAKKDYLCEQTKEYWQRNTVLSKDIEKRINHNIKIRKYRNNLSNNE